MSPFLRFSSEKYQKTKVRWNWSDSTLKKWPKFSDFFIIMKKTIWKRISESQLRKKNKFWSFVAKGKISICVGSSTIPRDSSEILLGGTFKKLGYRKGFNALRKEVSLIMYDPFNLSSII